MTNKMEARNKMTMCRLCLCENECFFNIFEVNGWHGYIAAEVISDLLHFNVTDSDGYPHVVCVTCLTKLTDFKVFKEQCQTSRVTYDNVFASNETLNDHQNQSEEFITIKAEPIDFLDNEEETSKELEVEVSPSALGYEYSGEEQTDEGESGRNEEEECDGGELETTKEDVSLQEDGHAEGSYCDSEICREDNMEDDLTEEQYQEMKSQDDGCRSESEDILDSLDDPSQSPVRLCLSAYGMQSSNGKVRKRRRLGLERKLEIIRKLEAGSSPASLGREYNLNESTIRTIRKMGDKIKEALGQRTSRDRSRVLKYKPDSGDEEIDIINDSKLDSDRRQNVDELLENDPQMQSILMEATAPPEVQRTPRRRKVITLGTKLEIIQKLESGMSAAAVGREYEMNESSVRTIWKMAEKIKASVAHTGSLNAKITRTRSALLEKMEKLLTKWVEMQTSLGIPTTPSVVRGKALVIYERLKKQQGAEDEPFMASKGWYDKFCKRQKIHVLKVERISEERQ